MRVNSSHHQAVGDPGRFATVDAVAPDGVIEGIEDTRFRFCLGVQWHPEFLGDPGGMVWRTVFQKNTELVTPQAR